MFGRTDCLINHTWEQFLKSEFLIRGNNNYKYKITSSQLVLMYNILS